MTLREALTAAKKALEALISGIEQHHATNLCESEPLYGAAHDAFPAIQAVREALATLPEDVTP